MRLSILLCVIWLFANPVFSQSITTENMAYYETVVKHSDNKLQSAGLLLSGVTIIGFSTVAVISGSNAVIYGGNLILTGGREVALAPFVILAGVFFVAGGMCGVGLGSVFSVPAIQGLTLSDEEKFRILGAIQNLKSKDKKNEKVIIINNQEQVMYELR